MTDLSAASLTAKDGAANTFEVKKFWSTTTDAELTFGPEGGSRDGQFGLVWTARIDLKDNKKFKFDLNAATSAFFEWDACVNDGTTDTPYRCTYVQMASSDKNFNEIKAWGTQVVEDDRPSGAKASLTLTTQPPTAPCWLKM